MPLIRFSFGVRRFSAGGDIFSGSGAAEFCAEIVFEGGVGACRGVSKADLRRSSSGNGGCEAAGGVFGRRGRGLPSVSACVARGSGSVGSMTSAVGGTVSDF